jgi:subtilisin family serine protease
MARDMSTELGINVPESADDNLFSNPHNITVGALDTRGTATPSDDTVASFSTRSPEVDVLANGVDVPVGDPAEGRTDTGTSMAAPDVSAEINRLAQANPGLGARERQNLLQQLNPPTVAGSNLSVVH